ncbi:MAG: hypothetical protein WBB01_18305 [Phormidesmis sp.]
MKASFTYPMPTAQAYWPFQTGSLRFNQRTVTVRLRDLWNTLQARFGPGCEPYAWETKTPTGQIVWNAYDPISGRLIRDASASEVRTWLEQRYSDV